MGGVSVDSGGKGGKKPVDSEVNMIPMIDLLMCCIMFLLVTAVWSQLARINSNQAVPGQGSPDQDSVPQEPSIKLFLQVRGAGYTLADTAGTRFEVDKVNGQYDLEGLRTKLRERRRQEPNRRDIIVAPEDGVTYNDVIRTMDLTVGEGYEDVSVSDGAAI
ncbi:MAG: biopolymer transporter ExbD [Deltaproteobacteria bacterium]|nr:biopolymer transporter ExbD [Deltaproteobacteria bacterium]